MRPLRARSLRRDVAVYGPLLAEQFLRDARPGAEPPDAGFAARHPAAPWLSDDL